MFASVARSKELPAQLHMRTLVVDNLAAPLGRENITLQHYADFMEFCESDIKQAPDAEVRAECFAAAATRGSATRRFCVTSSGFLGQVPLETQKGDEICILLGMKVPFVMRKLEGWETGRTAYRLVGECYIHGLMYGEALDLPGFILQDIELV
jgi:hypothetical protein